MELPLREQGTLLTAVRGGDLVPKLPLDSTARQLTACLRYAFMNPADEREIGLEPGSFFQTELPQDWKASELGHYPLHFYTHLMHAAEVIGYRHPDERIADPWRVVYAKMARALHLHPETNVEMAARLSEDRIATNTVVS